MMAPLQRPQGAPDPLDTPQHPSNLAWAASLFEKKGWSDPSTGALLVLSLGTDIPDELLDYHHIVRVGTIKPYTAAEGPGYIWITNSLNDVLEVATLLAPYLKQTACGSIARAIAGRH